MSKIDIDFLKLNSIINRAFDVTVEDLGEAFQNALTADIWEWPRETLRQNGDLVGSPRDIYDTGELYDSLVISRTEAAAEYTWKADYGLMADKLNSANCFLVFSDGGGSLEPNPQ